MNQLYSEAGVKRKDTTATLGLRALLVIGIFIGIMILLSGGFFSILGAGIIVIIFYLFPRLKVDYEYVFVDGQLDFDRIMGQSKRKTMLRIEFEQVDVMAPMGSHALDRYKSIQCEKKDFSSRDKNKKPYVIMAKVKSQQYMILFEPNEAMLNTIKLKNSRKVEAY